MTDGLLDDVNDIFFYFSDSLLEPINKINDQILKSLASYFGGKTSALYSLLENKINEIMKIFTTFELDDLLGDLYDLIKNNIKFM